MQKRSDLSDVQKGMIIGSRAKGGSISETANFVNCSRAAVVKVYRVWQYGTIQNQRRGTCGGPRAIDDRGERRLRIPDAVSSVPVEDIDTFKVTVTDSVSSVPVEDIHTIKVRIPDAVSSVPVEDIDTLKVRVTDAVSSVPVEDIDTIEVRVTDAVSTVTAEKLDNM
ncbi:hypothetical protein AVEN_14753-1 [Araneus ventricosus]|uniref:Uncharacterized protein n=1 Tax=Araneus ventricosus TaxID=182803 RepID=A0A4Y2N8M4_ARAVE|nr:hypothetical protein AVEN_14753-1 [Araneus ventricosus]